MEKIDKDIRDRNILSAYKPYLTSLREVAKICDTDHHIVKRVLLENGIDVVKASSKPLTKEHNTKISISTMGRSSWPSGKTMDFPARYKNMATHLRFDVDWVWLSQFSDIEKLKCLNICVTKSDRFDVDTEWYKQYILKFYDNIEFNVLYRRWLASNKEFYKKPSLDHIIPVSCGGTTDLSNIQFLSWFENRCKNNMTLEQWCYIKQNIHEYFV